MFKNICVTCVFFFRYLEKQDFLQRADLRQFEIEKELRNRTRKSFL